jgi:tape measure domain-containing protein
MSEQFHLGFDIDTKPLANAKTAAQDAAQAIGKLGDAEQKLGQQSQTAADSQKKLAESLAGGGGGGGLAGGAKAAAGGFDGLNGVLQSGVVRFGLVATAVKLVYDEVTQYARALADAQDRMALMEGRMKSALGSTYAAKDSMNSLYEATQKTGLGFANAADGFLRLARNADGLGATRAEIQSLSDVVQKLGVISGASRGEIASGSLQLSQALASGRLNGDELRSIMENMPAITKTLAENLGVSVGQIRAMGAAGELTGGKVFGALLASSEKVNREFEGLPSTTEREFQKVSDAWDMTLSKMAKAVNASGFLQAVAQGIIKIMPGAVEQGVNIGQVEALRRQIALTYGAGNFEQAQGNRQAEPQLRKLRELEAQLQRDFADAQAASKREEEIVGNKVLVQADPFVQETRDRATEVKKLNEQLYAIETGLTRLKTKQIGEDGGFKSLDASDTKRVAEYTQAQIILKQKLDDLRNPVELLGRDFGRLNAAIAQGGGGGATALIQQAQKMADDMRKTYGINGGGALDTIIRQEVVKGGDQIRNLDMQTAATGRLTAAIGENRNVVRELEIANEIATKRFQMFGDLKSPVIDGFFDRLTTAMRAQKRAADEGAIANAKYSNTLEATISGAQMSNISNDYQQRRVVAEMRAREAARTGRGDYESEMTKFETSEDLNRARSTENLRRQMQSNMERNDAGLGRLTSEEFRVQNALLQKRAELEQQGLQANDARYISALRLTETIERQNIEFEKQRKQVEAIESAVDSVGSTFKSSFVDSMTEAFKTGKFSASNFFQSIGDMAVRAGNEMVYEIAVRPLVTLAANAAKAGLSAYLNPAVSTIGGGVNNSAGTPSVSTMAWDGAAFDKGVKMFASGGVVDSPTLFKFANGGSVGMMGEAGTEGIFPLKRGPNGKLGVAAYGGGGGGDVQVVVNDMRTNKDSASIETSSGTDSNGMRRIQILVRDEIQRSMRAGEFDRTMQTNFGSQRQIARM